MSQISNFSQARTVLNKYLPRNGKSGSYSLERMQELMGALGDPQDKLKVIHVAGTSGKTSTCYYVTALLKQAGKKVGLTVSPHVDEVNERLQINLIPLPEKAFCNELEKFIDIVTKTGIEPTYFELLIAMAYWYFANQKVDYAIVEVGLGGLLDGTNVIGRQDKVCAITDIGLDHTNVLGSTIGEIAHQKAGIISDHNAVFMYQQTPDVMQAVNQKAKQMHAQLHIINLPAQNKIPVDLPPFQQRNFYLAESIYDYLKVRDDLPLLKGPQLLKATQTRVPARMEAISYQGRTIIIDGSHNKQKMAALVEGISKLYNGQKVAALVSFVDSEEERSKGALSQLLKLTDNLIITSFRGAQDTPKRSVDPKVIAKTAKRLGFKKIAIEIDPKVAFEQLMQRPEPVLVVTGSFYLLNHIRPLILKK